MTSNLISLAEKNEIARKIFNDRVKNLHSHLLATSLPAVFLCATVVYLGLYHIENKVLLLGWYLAIIASCMLRVGLVKWYERDPQHPERHLKIFLLSTAVSGLLWGFAGSVLTPPHHILPRVFVIIIIAGLSAGGCQTLKASRTANFLFMLTSILPLGLWTLFQGEAIYTYLSLALFGYLFFMLSIAHKTYLSFINSLQLQYENELLLKNLKKTNQELHQEIVGHEKAKTQLRYLASHDFLTGIDNRFSFDEEFEKILATARAQKSEFSVMYVDIDYFKAVNDNYGHALGDRMLVAVAQLLKRQLRSQDRLARIGGDEFIVMLVGSQVQMAAEQFVQAIFQALAEPIRLNGHALLLSVSIGGSFFPRDGNNKKVLLKKADAALYRAKTLGRNRYETYDEERKVFE